MNRYNDHIIAIARYLRDMLGKNTKISIGRNPMDFSKFTILYKNLERTKTLIVNENEIFCNEPDCLLKLVNKLKYKHYDK